MKRLVSLFLSVLMLLGMTSVVLASNVPLEEEISSMSTLGINMATKVTDDMISHKAGVWGSSIVTMQKVNDLDSTVRGEGEWIPGFNQTIFGGIVGYNHELAFGTIGAFLGLNQVNQKFYDDSVGKISIGIIGVQSTSNIFDLFDLSFSIRGNFINQDIKGYLKSKTFGVVGSVGISRDFKLGNTFVITPQASYSQLYINPYIFDDYRMAYVFNVIPEAGYYTYVGVSAGQDFGKLSYLLNVGWIYDSCNSTILLSYNDFDTNGEHGRIDLDSNRHSLKVGAELAYDFINLKISSVIGKQTKDLFNIQLGVKYQF